ncbi:triosephosphate isomerase, partial [Thermodesulfobacteriota bacterium]
MVEIFVNLKRFEVPKKIGGVCPETNPKKWIESILEKSVGFGLGKSDKVHLTYLLPELLVIPALEKVKTYPKSEIKSLHIGCQSVFREN